MRKFLDIRKNGLQLTGEPWKQKRSCGLFPGCWRVDQILTFVVMLMRDFSPRVCSAEVYHVLLIDIQFLWVMSAFFVKSWACCTHLTKASTYHLSCCGVHWKSFRLALLLQATTALVCHNKERDDSKTGWSMFRVLILRYMYLQIISKRKRSCMQAAEMNFINFLFR